jgi:protein-S-isoprenylcysteine O-methyltransferase Ste14
MTMAFMVSTMCTNSFAAPVVKIQKERGQKVITTGPYAIVRHPLYFGALF